MIIQMSGISIEVARRLLECFGGEDEDITIAYLEDGHSGPGYYAAWTEYPEEGSEYLGPKAA